VNGEYSGFIYLNYGKTKDSVRVVNNRFEFKVSLERPCQSYMNLNEYSASEYLWIENSDIEIKADVVVDSTNGKSIHVLKINEVKGSHSDILAKDIKLFYQTNKAKDNFSSLLVEKLKTFVKQNGDHPLSGELVAEFAVVGAFFTVEELRELYSLIDTTKQTVFSLETIKQGIATLEKYGIGKPFMKFKLPDIDGKEVHMESYLGKIILIDFWASWCGPCRVNNPGLVKLKNKYSNRDFDIVGISTDDDREGWLKAIKRDNLSWTNLHDVNDEVANELGVVAIPLTYLLDRDGNIIGKGLTIEQIERIVEEKTKTWIK